MPESRKQAADQRRKFRELQDRVVRHQRQREEAIERRVQRDRERVRRSYRRPDR